jgi:hypothetical protein
MGLVETAGVGGFEPHRSSTALGSCLIPGSEWLRMRRERPVLVPGP